MPKTTKHDPENPIWTKEDFARAVPFSGLPVRLQEKLRKVQQDASAASDRKIPVSIRLSEDVVRALEESGADWPTRVDQMLRERLAM